LTGRQAGLPIRAHGPIALYNIHSHRIYFVSTLITDLEIFVEFREFGIEKKAKLKRNQNVNSQC